MKKIITINEELCKDINPCYIYLALAIIKSKGCISKPFKEMLNEKLVIDINGTYSVTNDFRKKISEIILNSKSKIDESYIEEIYFEMKDLFPKGQKCTGIYWRGNKKDCMEKLKKFFIQYGDYTKEEIINATKKYISSFADNTYMQCLNYFIMKDGKSTLASVLENEENTEIVEYNNVLTFDE